MVACEATMGYKKKRLREAEEGLRFVPNWRIMLEEGGKAMNISNLFKRIAVKLLRVRPKIFAGEEKEQIRARMIEANRAQDRDITTCKAELIEGLELSRAALPEASGWLVSQTGNPKEKIIYYIHGGGFVGACTKERMPFVSTLVREFGYNVFSVDYRLAPEFMHPCAVYDCLDGYQWLFERYAPENILLLGESAGGTLVLALSLLLRDRGLPLPKAVYANSPAAQMAEYTERRSFTPTFSLPPPSVPIRRSTCSFGSI